MTRMDTRFLGISDLDDVPSVAVVVEVMRAFTVAAWAFSRGAEKIVLAGSPDESLELKAAHPDWAALKDGPPAPGFDLVRPTRMFSSAFMVLPPTVSPVRRPPGPCRPAVRENAGDGGGPPGSIR